MLQRVGRAADRTLPRMPQSAKARTNVGALLALKNTVVWIRVALLPPSVDHV